MIAKWILLGFAGVCVLLAIVYRAKVARLIERGQEFYKEVKVEMRKVSWPTREEVIGNTFVVLAGATALALIIGVFDWGLGHVVQWVFVR